jgi:hypothetical protein
VVAVLVRDQDGGKRFGGDADGGQALEGFLAGESRIDQEARALRGNESAVAGTGRRKYREFKDDGASYLLDAETA